MIFVYYLNTQQMNEWKWFSIISHILRYMPESSWSRTLAERCRRNMCLAVAWYSKEFDCVYYYIFVIKNSITLLMYVHYNIDVTKMFSCRPHVGISEYFCTMTFSVVYWICAIACTVWTRISKTKTKTKIVIVIVFQRPIVLLLFIR